MTIGAKGIDERHWDCRIEGDGGDCPMASRVHKPNGKSRFSCEIPAREESCMKLIPVILPVALMITLVGCTPAVGRTGTKLTLSTIQTSYGTQVVATKSASKAVAFYLRDLRAQPMDVTFSSPDATVQQVATPPTSVDLGKIAVLNTITGLVTPVKTGTVIVVATDSSGMSASTTVQLNPITFIGAQWSSGPIGGPTSPPQPVGYYGGQNQTMDFTLSGSLNSGTMVNKSCDWTDATWAAYTAHPATFVADSNGWKTNPTWTWAAIDGILYANIGNDVVLVYTFLSDKKLLITVGTGTSFPPGTTIFFTRP
jgi:hypothetical protein